MRSLLFALRLIRMIIPKTLLFMKIQSKPQDRMLANKRRERLPGSVLFLH